MIYGANPVPSGGVQFRVWAPAPARMALRIAGREPIPMNRSGEDFELFVPDARTGDRYFFILDGAEERPDPRSRLQPEGVHGRSEVVDANSFAWSDAAWTGIHLRDYLLYELHVGTFTQQGTFGGVQSKLSYLRDLGVTAIELMPVAQFPGDRNWGYDGVDLYAPHSSYGGPNGLKALVNAAHEIGLAVVLDVVYNHIGPEGNYLGGFGPYFTTRYQTPWGPAINYDGPGCDGVRQFFIENALYWLTEYHIDALRLDAIHGIFDFSAFHVLAELRDRFHAEAQRLGRRAFVIAESDLNDVRVIQRRQQGGYALDAQWHDEFHHSVISVLTGGSRGYLAGFGRLSHIQKAITHGFVYDGIYSSYRKRRFGNSSKDQPGERFVAFVQNHDQIANTAQGFRLSELVTIEEAKMAALLLIGSPYLPLLFMGEEFAETAPFLYFTSHGDRALARAVSEGRRQEFAEFAGGGEFADPQAVSTFEQSRLSWQLLERAGHAEVLQFYRELLALRKRWPCLANCRKDLTTVHVEEDAALLRIERADPSGSQATLLFNFSPDSAEFRFQRNLPPGPPAVSTRDEPAKSAGMIRLGGRSAALYLSQQNLAH
ncbi:MAG TPA: malto-oligosyltrehalose trehalohydrolase [Bryobacteraceae bacterium]|nr:malto-oligosyltrehalose trehalohydrolase [Bryobacteraceae bacterium]